MHRFIGQTWWKWDNFNYIFEHAKNLPGKKIEKILVNKVLTCSTCLKNKKSNRFRIYDKKGKLLAYSWHKLFFKYKKTLFILLPHFFTSCITNSGEEVLHDPFENGKINSTIRKIWGITFNFDVFENNIYTMIP